MFSTPVASDPDLFLFCYGIRHCGATSTDKGIKIIYSYTQENISLFSHKGVQMSLNKLFHGPFLLIFLCFLGFFLGLGFVLCSMRFILKSFLSSCKILKLSWTVRDWFMSLYICLFQDGEKFQRFLMFWKRFLIHVPFLATGKYVLSLVAYVATISRWTLCSTQAFTL